MSNFVHAYEKSCLLEYIVLFFSAFEASTACPNCRTTVNQVKHLLKSSESFCLRVENWVNVTKYLLVFIVDYFSAFDSRTARCQSNYAIVQIDCDHVWPSKILECLVAFEL